MPYRGPRELVDGEFKYINELNGEVDNFFGEEKIYKGDTLLYVAKYIGGFIDKKLMVGETGLEPAASASQTQRSSQLNYSPKQQILPQ